MPLPYLVGKFHQDRDTQLPSAVGKFHCGHPVDLISLFSLTWLRLAALAHDLPELVQVGIIVVEAHDETRNCVLGGAPRRSVGNVQVWLVGPGVQHCQAHTAALFEAMLHLREGTHCSPGGLVARATLHRQATSKGQRKRQLLPQLRL